MAKIGPGLTPGQKFGDDGFGVTYRAGVQDESGKWTFDPAAVGQGDKGGSKDPQTAKDKKARNA